MNTSNDEIGNLLRRYYAMYGMPQEGPPPGWNGAQLGGVIPESELQLLVRALDDKGAQREFQVCRTLLDDLASRLTGEALLAELTGIPLPSEHAFEQLSSGVFWFSLAASLDSRNHGAPVTPFDDFLNLPLPLKAQMTVHGSLVLRLYIALVYMREGVLNDLITESARAGGPCSGQVRRLLNSDYVRRIRNALSHGSFEACIAGIVFRGDHGTIVATPWVLKLPVHVAHVGSTSGSSSQYQEPRRCSLDASSTHGGPLQ